MRNATLIYMYAFEHEHVLGPPRLVRPLKIWSGYQAYKCKHRHFSLNTHIDTHTIVFLILLVICSHIFLRTNCQIVLFIAAQLGAHTLWAVSTCLKAEEKNKAVLAPHTQIPSFSEGPYENSRASDQKSNACFIVVRKHNDSAHIIIISTPALAKWQQNWFLNAISSL